VTADLQALMKERLIPVPPDAAIALRYKGGRMGGPMGVRFFTGPTEEIADVMADYAAQCADELQSGRLSVVVCLGADFVIDTDHGLEVVVMCS
jgi:hypothetical protein